MVESDTFLFNSSTACTTSGSLGSYGLTYDLSVCRCTTYLRRGASNCAVFAERAFDSHTMAPIKVCSSDAVLGCGVSSILLLFCSCMLTPSLPIVYPRKSMDFWKNELFSIFKVMLRSARRCVNLSSRAACSTSTDSSLSPGFRFEQIAQSST